MVGINAPQWAVNEVRVQKTAKGETYLLKDPLTGRVMRTGRTNDLHRRELEHGRQPETTNLDFELDRRTDDYAQQRGREQILHDRYNPPLNRIRPISLKSRNLQKYLDAAKDLE
jgi:hypothetical protein